MHSLYYIHSMYKTHWHSAYLTVYGNLWLETRFGNGNTHCHIGHLTPYGNLTRNMCKKCKQIIDIIITVIIISIICLHFLDMCKFLYEEK